MAEWMEAYLYKIVHCLARSHLALSGHGKRPQMLWDSIWSCPHARSSGTGIFTRIRSNLTNLEERKNRKWVISENNLRKLKQEGRNDYFKEVWDGTEEKTKLKERNGSKKEEKRNPAEPMLNFRRSPCSISGGFRCAAAHKTEVFIEKLNKTSAFSVVETWKREVRKLNGNSEKSHSESFRHE